MTDAGIPLTLPLSDSQVAGIEPVACVVSTDGNFKWMTLPSRMTCMRAKVASVVKTLEEEIDDAIQWLDDHQLAQVMSRWRCESVLSCPMLGLSASTVRVARFVAPCTAYVALLFVSTRHIFVCLVSMLRTAVIGCRQARLLAAKTRLEQVLQKVPGQHALGPR